jgi:hypothetical protein
MAAPLKPPRGILVFRGNPVGNHFLLLLGLKTMSEVGIQKWICERPLRIVNSIRWPCRGANYIFKQVPEQNFSKTVAKNEHFL